MRRIATLIAALLAGAAASQTIDTKIVDVTYKGTQAIYARAFKAYVANIEKMTKQKDPSFKGFGPKEREEWLDKKIEEIVYLQAAKDEGVAVSDTELDQKIASIRETYGPGLNDEQFQARIKEDTGFSYAEYRTIIQSQMIRERFILSRLVKMAEKLVSDDAANKEIDKIRANLEALAKQKNPSAVYGKAEFERDMQSLYKMSLDDFRRQVKLNLAYADLAKEASELKLFAPPTEQEVTRYYELNSTNFTRKETVRYSVISVPTIGKDETGKKLAADLAESLAKEAKAGGFDAIIARARADKTLGYSGGDGGYATKDSSYMSAVGEELFSILFSLELGGVSKPVLTPAGYVIIRITEKYLPKLLELGDIANLSTKETVAQGIFNALLQQKAQEGVLRLVEKKTTEELLKATTLKPADYKKKFSFNW
jgi:parvulin-like peptidyl-prolyl isomerase